MGLAPVGGSPAGQGENALHRMRIRGGQGRALWLYPPRPPVRRPHGCVAQLVEQLTLNQRVTGSIPVAPTIPRLCWGFPRSRFTLGSAFYTSGLSRSRIDRCDDVAAGQIVLPGNGRALRFRVAVSIQAAGYQPASVRSHPAPDGAVPWRCGCRATAIWQSCSLDRLPIASLETPCEWIGRGINVGLG